MVFEVYWNVNMDAHFENYPYDQHSNPAPRLWKKRLLSHQSYARRTRSRALPSEMLEEALVALAQQNLNPSEDRYPGQICILCKQLLGNTGITCQQGCLLRTCTSSMTLQHALPVTSRATTSGIFQKIKDTLPRESVYNTKHNEDTLI